LKLLLAERRFKHVRVLHEELLDLQAEGMVSRPKRGRTCKQSSMTRAGLPWPWCCRSMSLRRKSSTSRWDPIRMSRS
jgi:hypothetical protein